MASTELIEQLNRALSLELAAVVQYMQHSFLVNHRSTRPRLAIRLWLSEDCPRLSLR
jgi:bacterioferritin (cytochrome b1)